MYILTFKKHYRKINNHNTIFIKDIFAKSMQRQYVLIDSGERYTNISLFHSVVSTRCIRKILKRPVRKPPLCKKVAIPCSVQRDPRSVYKLLIEKKCFVVLFFLIFAIV